MNKEKTYAEAQVRDENKMIILHVVKSTRMLYNSLEPMPD